MNILHITNHLDIGGITSYVLTLTRGLKQKGHNLFIASSAGRLLSKFAEQGIIYIPIPIRTKSEISPKILASAFKLTKAIKQNKIDIVHSHSRTTGVVACLLNIATSVEYVSTCHGFFKPRLSRRIFPCWGRKVIAISESVKNHLVEDFKVSEQKIKVIHNGIDLDNFRIADSIAVIDIKNKFGLKGGPVVGIIARLSDVKGHIYLIKAMSAVLNEYPEAELLIVGDGKMKKRLVELSKDLGIEKSVVFAPSVIDCAQVLSAMDIFVMPSLKEGLGLSLMEAMAGGLAVIGSDVGGIRSLIRNGDNGLLVEPADTADLSLKILSLLQNPAQREFLGKNARIFINQNFSKEKMISQTEKVYLECLNGKY